MPVYRAIFLFVPVVLTALLCACGPRSDNAAPAPYDAGARPGIVSIGFGVPTAVYAVDAGRSGDNMIFWIGYTLNAVDEDANMRAVEVQVTWTPRCNSFTETWRATEDIPVEFWGAQEAQIIGVTADPVEVPINCLAEGDLFSVSARIIDARGNSDTFGDQLKIQVSQG